MNEALMSRLHLYVSARFDALRNNKPKITMTPTRRREIPRYVITGVTAAAVISVLTGYGANGLCNIAGFLYPLYQSFKALRTDDKQDDTQWLTYWVVYGFVNVTERWIRFFFQWVPFYYGWKMIFLVWCFFPRTRGADVIYRSFLEPLLLKYEQRIDRVCSKVVDEATEHAQDVLRSTQRVIQGKITQVGQEIVTDVVRTVTDPQNINEIKEQLIATVNNSQSQQTPPQSQQISALTSVSNAIASWTTTPFKQPSDAPTP
jgi:receptor expression-enhancing protein 5/6